MTTDSPQQPIPHTGSRPIPWLNLFRESLTFAKNPSLVLLGFFLLTAVTSLLMRPLNDLDWTSMTPLILFTSMTSALVLCAFNFFVFVALVLWTWDSVTHTARPLGEIFKTTTSLMVPITVLSIRGGIFTVLGLFLLVLPGLYYFLKYELALFCLIFEGWNEQPSPIQRAEQIISQYRFSLLFIGGLMLAQAAFAWVVEGLLRWNEVEMTLAVKLGIALLDGIVTLFVNIYLTMTALYLVGQVPFQRAAASDKKPELNSNS